MCVIASLRLRAAFPYRNVQRRNWISLLKRIFSSRVAVPHDVLRRVFHVPSGEHLALFHGETFYDVVWCIHFIHSFTCLLGKPSSSCKFGRTTKCVTGSSSSDECRLFDEEQRMRQHRPQAHVCCRQGSRRHDIRGVRGELTALTVQVLPAERE